MTNSREKGKRGEREFAAFLRDHGYDDAHRGVQFRGGPDSPDVSGFPGHHVEVKRQERVEIVKWCHQAETDAAGVAVPIVAWRQNGEPWRVTLSAEDYLRVLNRA